MKYQWVVPLFAALANFVMGAVALSRDRRSPLYLAFGFLTGTVVMWNLNIFGFYFFETPSAAFQWARVFRVGTLLMPAALATFVYVFAQRSGVWRRGTVLLCVGLSVFLVTANAFDLVVAEVRWFGWGYYSVGTRLYNLFAADLVVAAGYVAVVLLGESWMSDSPRKRLQVRLWLFAGAIALPLGLTNLLPAYGFRTYPLGNLANVVYVGVVAYAIVRHRLMDIDVAITKGMAYAAVSFLLIGPSFLLMLWLQRISFGHIHPDFSAAILVTLIAVGVLFPTLRLRAESRIERSLFREKHEYRAALGGFTRSIVRILDSEELLRQLAETLSSTLQLERTGIHLADKERRAYTVRSRIGGNADIEDFACDHPFIIALASRQQSVLRDEFEASLDANDQQAAEFYRRNGWELCIPLVAGRELIGFISLGRKRNLDTFSAGDLELLETLGAEASVALENARLYEELKKSHEIIRRADRLSALGTLAAGIAHEIRNPLVSIQTFFQLAPERLHDEEFLTSFLAMTGNEVKRISDLISELLSFARSPTPSLRPVDLNETVERVAALLDPEARKHKLTIERALSPILPLTNADADQMKQVLINLVLNAIQATPPDGTVSVKTSPLQRGSTLHCRLEVRDTGVGISKDRLDHIFNPFFTTKDKGTGLGLAIAHQIVVEHGGLISVDSKEGVATTFFIDLPAIESAIAAEEIMIEGADAERRRYKQSRKIAS